MGGDGDLSRRRWCGVGVLSLVGARAGGRRRFRGRVGRRSEQRPVARGGHRPRTRHARARRRLSRRAVRRSVGDLSPRRDRVRLRRGTGLGRAQRTRRSCGVRPASWPRCAECALAPPRRGRQRSRALVPHLFAGGFRVRRRADGRARFDRALPLRSRSGPTRSSASSGWWRPLPISRLEPSTAPFGGGRSSSARMGCASKAGVPVSFRSRRWLAPTSTRGACSWS